MFQEWWVCTILRSSVPNPVLGVQKAARTLSPHPQQHQLNGRGQESPAHVSPFPRPATRQQRGRMLRSTPDSGIDTISAVLHPPTYVPGWGLQVQLSQLHDLRPRQLHGSLWQLPVWLGKLLINHSARAGSATTGIFTGKFIQIKISLKHLKQKISSSYWWIFDHLLHFYRILLKMTKLSGWWSGLGWMVQIIFNCNTEVVQKCGMVVPYC